MPHLWVHIIHFNRFDLISSINSAPVSLTVLDFRYQSAESAG